MINYAKRIDNTLTPAPYEVVVGECRVFNPSAQILRELGYKEVVYPAAAESSTLAAESDPALAAESDPAGLIPEPICDTPQREVYTEDAEHIYVSYVLAESAPVPDLALLREQAYRTEADQYLIAYEGYVLEGRAAEAEEQKALYLAAKAAIRERFSEEEDLAQ